MDRSFNGGLPQAAGLQLSNPNTAKWKVLASDAESSQQRQFLVVAKSTAQRSVLVQKLSEVPAQSSCGKLLRTEQRKSSVVGKRVAGRSALIHKSPSTSADQHTSTTQAVVQCWVYIACLSGVVQLRVIAGGFEEKKKMFEESGRILISGKKEPHGTIYRSRSDLRLLPARNIPGPLTGDGRQSRISTVQLGASHVLWNVKSEPSMTAMSVGRAGGAEKALSYC